MTLLGALVCVQSSGHDVISRGQPPAYIALSIRRCTLAYAALENHDQDVWHQQKHAGMHANLRKLLLGNCFHQILLYVGTPAVCEFGQLSTLIRLGAVIAALPIVDAFQNLCNTIWERGLRATDTKEQ